MKRDVDVWLKALAKYVRASLDHRAAKAIRHVTCKHSNKAEVNNQRSARSFCYVHLDADPVVYYAEALELLDVEYIVGILLHELAHLIVKSGTVDDEVDADQWVIEAFPEAKYGYDDAVYTSPWTHRWRTAKNLQCVSREFIRRLLV